MNLVKTIEQYNENNLFFCEPIKNNVMNEGIFVRVLYSAENIVINGIYLLVNINDIVCDKYYNKYKCLFNSANHFDLIEQLRIIEENILKKYKTTKTPCYKIHEQMRCGIIKLFTNIGSQPYCSFILKISGIWETHANCGLTYKFTKINYKYPMSKINE
jgi:hypothetical protein